MSCICTQPRSNACSRREVGQLLISRVPRLQHPVRRPQLQSEKEQKEEWTRTRKKKAMGSEIHARYWHWLAFVLIIGPIRSESVAATRLARGVAGSARTVTLREYLLNTNLPASARNGF